MQVLHIADIRVWCGAAPVGANGEPQKLRTEGGCQEGQAAIASLAGQNGALMLSQHRLTEPHNVLKRARTPVQKFH